MTGTSSAGGDLPIEIVEKIITRLPRADVGVLTRVSQGFSAIATPSLYARLDFSNRRQLKELLKTLKSCPSKSALVGSVTVSEGLSRDPKCADLLSKILKKLTYLAEFDMTCSEMGKGDLSKIINAFETAHLKRLVFFTTDQPIGHLVTGIITKHRNLEEFQLSPSAQLAGMKGTMALPKLKTFVGPGACFHDPMMKLPLKSVSIGWEEGVSTSVMEVDIRKVALCCGDTLESFSCFKAGSSVALLQFISSYLPKLRHLEISGTVVDSQDVINVLVMQLDALRLLHSFEFNPIVARQPTGELELRAIIEEVGSLREFCCHGLTWKKQVRQVRQRRE